MPGLERSAERARTEPGWRYVELASDHNPQYAAPEALTAARCAAAGANVMVAGSSTFRAPDMAAAVAAIRTA